MHDEDPSISSDADDSGSSAGRLAKWSRVIAMLLLVAGVLLALGAPVVKGILTDVSDWIASLGVWGFVMFIAIYILATVLMAPGSVLTLAAAPLFGLLGGFVAVSIGSTTGAALAFLIARYLARDRIARRIAGYPKFAAVERAISTGGWKIVALLRLSPAVPFNLQNYLYGLTRIGFVAAVFTSWLAMMPGTFLYVYLGYLGGETAQAAAGDGGSSSALKWTLNIVGVLATILVTVYVTKLAKRELARVTDLEESPAAKADRKPPRVPWLLVAVALLVFAGGLWLRFG